MFIIRNCTNSCLCNIISKTINRSILNRVTNPTLYYKVELYIFSNYFSTFKVHNSNGFGFNKSFRYTSSFNATDEGSM